MSGIGRALKYWGKWGKVLENAGDRARKVRKRWKDDPGKYKPEDLAADIVEMWIDGVDAWLDTGSSAASVPVCFITGASGSTKDGILSLPDSLKTLPTKPDLFGVKEDESGVKVIKTVTLAFTDGKVADEIKVTVNIPPSAKGLYHGAVIDGTALLGTIVLQVT